MNSTDLQFHTFPHYNVLAVSEGAWRTGPYCPQCGHASAGIHCDREPGLRVIRCIVCGWRAERKNSKRAMQRGPEPVHAPQPHRLSLAEQIAQNEALYCTRCENNHRQKLSIYCSECKQQAQRESNERFQAKQRGEITLDPALIDTLVEELTHYIAAEAVA